MFADYYTENPNPDDENLDFPYYKVKLLRSEIAYGSGFLPNGEVKEKFNLTMSKANNFIGKANFTKRRGFVFDLSRPAKCRNC